MRKTYNRYSLHLKYEFLSLIAFYLLKIDKFGEIVRNPKKQKQKNEKNSLVMMIKLFSFRYVNRISNANERLANTNC